MTTVRYVAAWLVVLGVNAACAQPLLRISTENTAEHFQTAVVADFAERLQARAGERLQVRFFPNARLYRDRDVVAALREGKVEMAVPGTWQLGRFAPGVGLYLLPLFYGQPREVQWRLQDGALGEHIDADIQRGTRARVLGRWIDLGHTQLYFLQHAIHHHEDLAGLRIRIAGGLANAARLRGLGAEPVLVAWPDLPQALTGDEIDGLLTSHVTVASARLWELGVSHAFEDRQYFARYVPLVAASFWQRLPGELQALIADTWEEGVASARATAASAQARARETLQNHDIRIVSPPAAALQRWRQRLLALQPALVEELGIDPALVALAREALDQ